MIKSSPISQMKQVPSQNSLVVKKKTEKKLKELTKFETKIEQNLETHKKSLTFFKRMIIVLCVHKR